MKKILVLILMTVVLASCTRHVDKIKANADVVMKQNNFEIVGYQGYTFGLFGGNVWYMVKRVPDNGILYEVSITRWFNEFHLYHVEAIDAIKPQLQN